MSSLVRIICLTFCGVLCLLPPAHAAPALVNYQGALAGANGVPLDGPVTVTFAIHEAPVAGVPLWQEVQVVQVQKGAFAVLLGSETPFPEDLFAADALWLELVVGSETLSPRQRLASVPYALNARRAGCNPGDFILCFSGDSSGIDVGICRAGKRFCLPNGSGFGDCSGEILPSLEICDGVDNDCDPATADGVNEPTLGNLCDGTDADLCMEGTVSCVVGKGLGCSDVTGNTLDICNGSDDDCDAASADGSEDPQFGQACDGTDSDLCLEGTRSCSAGTLICSDSTGSVVDVCNGSDDDCDAASADGSEDPLIGIACDGTDTDLCLEGTRSCSAGALICSDSSGSVVDVCNGSDDDCDAASADGSEDPLIGTACDGTDTDLCLEGTRSCSAGALICSDITGSVVDICNGINDDCDNASADGSEDPLIGTACDGADNDGCLEGTRSCSAGALVCSDLTGNTFEICDGLDNDCDGVADEGCL